MALGGIVAARRVAETLARELTPMTPAEGFAANAATALLVTAASRFALPVSTTHIATGESFAIGAKRGELRWKIAGEVALAWLVTLPLAALLGALAMLALD
jgi:PiT family inorganic phosphate transporter